MKYIKQKLRQVSNFSDEIWTEVGKAIGFVLLGMSGYLVPKLSKYVKNKIQQRYFNSSLKKSVEIKVKLAEVKTALGADRIYFFQFHNGTVYLGDHAFHKYNMSAIFEIVGQGLSREIQSYQSMPMSKFAEVVSSAMDTESDVLIIGNHRGCDMSFSDADLDDMYYTIQPVTTAWIKVLNKKKNFIGFICIAFGTEITKSKFAEMRTDTALNALLTDVKNIL